MTMWLSRPLLEKMNPQKKLEPTLSVIGHLVSIFLIFMSFGYFGISLVFGIVLYFGPSKWIINGTPRSIHEPLIGQGLLCLSGFFLINLVMFSVSRLFVSVSTNKKGSPWFYSFNIGLIGLIAALFIFVQRIGYNTTENLLICAGMNLLGIFIASFLVYYIHSIASPFKADGTDSCFKMRIIDNDPNSINNYLLRKRQQNGISNNF